MQPVNDQGVWQEPDTGPAPGLASTDTSDRNGDVRDRPLSPKASEAITRAACRLTARDRYLLGLVTDHSVMDTHQLAHLAECCERRVRLRLAIMEEAGVIGRFRPLTETGSAPCHYVATRTGASLVALSRGAYAAKVIGSTDEAARWAASAQLAHRIGVNWVLASLIHESRKRPSAHLCAFWPEATCRLAWGPTVCPDAYGVVVEDGRPYAFFLEYDRGTEPARRVADKLARYEKLAAKIGHPTWVLFAFENPGRERSLEPTLVEARVPVATAELSGPQEGKGAGAAVWAPVGYSGPRLRIAELSNPSAQIATQGALAAARRGDR